MLVWDETGARNYETGVSRGIFFPIDGSPGVPWNGLVGVTMDPQGGSLESYWFDGTKYMDRTLAEDFQATVQAISTPKEFEKSEGVRPVEGSFGGKTHFNKRDKFHMAWRTEIGNDQTPNAAYKIHIVYNCLVQPSARAYQTISDATTPDIRSFVITATPACFKQAYFVFDSREGDLSALEAQLNNGVLPRCWDLPALTGAPGGSGPAPGDPDAGCASKILDLENYVHGQEVHDVSDLYYSVQGLINNGLDIVELPAAGAFAANDSAASEVGTHPVLVDDDDATYVTSAQGDLGYTIGLPPLVGYVDGCALELHIRASISGGVSPDDPDNVDADMQVHISTDATGDTTVGGFSDGADEGMGFALAVVDGTPVDYVVPLSMDAWVDSTIDDVVTVLEAGAYLNVVGATNNNPDTTPEVRVYEARLVMLNDTDSDKWLRAVPGSIYPQLDLYWPIDDAYTEDQIDSHTSYIDFKLIEVDYNGAAEDFVLDVLSYAGLTTAVPGILKVVGTGDEPTVTWYDTDGTSVLDSGVLESNKWYRATVKWTYDKIHVAVGDRNGDEALLINYDEDRISTSPKPTVHSYGGFTSGPTKTFEVVLDNLKTQIHCHDVAPVSEWICFDLSTAVPFLSRAAQSWVPLNTPMAVYSGGELHNNPDWGTTVTFAMPGFTLDPTKTYEFRITYETVGYRFGIMQQNPSWAVFNDNRELGFTFPTSNEIHLTVGPGIDDWDLAVTDGYQSLIRFDASDGVTSLCYKEV